jgi:DNA polymerase-4
MHPEPQIKWLFLDLNSYFASVEQQDNPVLRGQPVAVVPMETDYTCAIAASYEAKKFGVKTGTKILEARELCPGLACVLARHDAYVRYHHRILDEVGPPHAGRQSLLDR